MSDDATHDIPPEDQPPDIGSGSTGAIPKQIGKCHIKSLNAIEAGTVYWHWHNVVICHLALDEARTLIRGSSGPQ